MKLFSWKKKPKTPKTDMNINVFFKAFILDTLKELPTEKNDLIEKMNLDKIFSTDFNDWKKTIKNSEISKNDGTELNADQFADLFIENYFVENSKVDIWENESDFNNAKNRIAESNLSE